MKSSNGYALYETRELNLQVERLFAKASFTEKGAALLAIATAAAGQSLVPPLPLMASILSVGCVGTVLYLRHEGEKLRIQAERRKRRILIADAKGEAVPGLATANQNLTNAHKEILERLMSNDYYLAREASSYKGRLCEIVIENAYFSACLYEKKGRAPFIKALLFLACLLIIAFLLPYWSLPFFGHNGTALVSDQQLLSLYRSGAGVLASVVLAVLGLGSLRDGLAYAHGAHDLKALSHAVGHMMAKDFSLEDALDSFMAYRRIVETRPYIGDKFYEMHREAAQKETAEMFAQIPASK